MTHLFEILGAHVNETDPNDMITQVQYDALSPTDQTNYTTQRSDYRTYANYDVGS